MLSEIDARVFGSMFEQQFLKTMLGFSDERRKRDFKVYTVALAGGFIEALMINFLHSVSNSG